MAKHVSKKRRWINAHTNSHERHWSVPVIAQHASAGADFWNKEVPSPQIVSTALRAVQRGVGADAPASLLPLVIFGVHAQLRLSGQVSILTAVRCGCLKILFLHSLALTGGLGAAEPPASPSSLRVLQVFSAVSVSPTQDQQSSKESPLFLSPFSPAETNGQEVQGELPAHHTGWGARPGKLLYHAMIPGHGCCV